MVPAPVIGAVATFDIARTSHPPRRLGSAIVVVDGGVFLGTPTAVMTIGVVQTLHHRRCTIRALIARDPDAHAALRRVVHLSPPT